MNEGESGALFSPDRVYRYALWRFWEPSKPWFVTIGLNPSVADEVQDDPTIRRCIGYAKREGLGGLIMLNLFAYRATQPGVMMSVRDPIGPGNDATIGQYLNMPQASIVLAAWGAFGGHMDRDKTIIERHGSRLAALGLTRFGKPRHPLYMRADAPLIYPWRADV